MAPPHGNRPFRPPAKDAIPHSGKYLFITKLAEEKPILPPENMMAKNVKIAPRTGTQRKKEELDRELASCSKKMKGIAHPGYFYLVVL